MNKTVRRIIAIVLIIGLSVLIARKMVSMKEAPRKNPDKATTSLVEVISFEPGDENMVIAVSGRIRSKQKIDVYSEVTGKLRSGSRPFREGNKFMKGQVLLQLDDTDARMNVNALRSTFQTNLTMLLADIKIDHKDHFTEWNSYVNQLDPTQVLAELPAVNNAHLKNFLVGKGIYQLFYQIRAAEAQLRKFTLVAPFTGVVAMANVTEGEVIRAGQPVGVFLQTDGYELEVGVNIQQREKIAVGNQINLVSADKTGSWTGAISRISESVDPATQTVKIYIDVKGTDLYDGMYLSGALVAGIAHDVISYPANLVSDENRVYAVQDSVLRSMPIEVVHREADVVLIKGLPDHTQLIANVVPGARDGMTVRIKKSKP